MCIVDFAVPIGRRVKKKRKPKNRQILGPCQRTKKAMEHESDSHTNCSWCNWNGPQRIEKGIQTIRNQRKNRDDSDYGIIEISQNTEKRPGYLGRLAVTQILVKDHQLTLTGKSSKE